MTKPNTIPAVSVTYTQAGTGCNVGVNTETGQIQLEIKGLAEPKSQEAQRVCREDLTELVTAFVQDKPTIERGLFDEELPPSSDKLRRSRNHDCSPRKIPHPNP
jgi:hypothetical protein